MIKIQNLSLKTDNTILLDDITLLFPDNKISVIVGSNGIGKTTLLRTIMGFSKPSKGFIESDNKDLFYLPQKIKYPVGITLTEYIESVLFKNNWKWFLSKQEKQKINEVIEMLELGNKKEINIEKLSSGELQKANIALGLVSNASTFILDEPTSNMDLINQVKILDMLKTLTKDKITAIIVMHDINLAAMYGDYFIGLTKSHKVIAANKEIFFTEDKLQKIFGIKFKVFRENEYINIQIDNN